MSSEQPVSKQTGILLDLSNVDGNIFHIVGHAGIALRKSGREDWREIRDSLQKEVFAANSYHEALGVVMSYFEVIA